MSSTQNTVNTINSGIAAYGRTKTYLNTAIASVISICFIIVGVYLLRSSLKNKDKIKSTQARIESIVDEDIIPSRRRSRSYIANISYKVNDKEYKKNITLNSYESIGSFITVYYDINDPNNVTATSNTTTGLVGGGMILCALLLCGFMFFNSYMVSKSDIAASESVLSEWRRPYYRY